MMQEAAVPLRSRPQFAWGLRGREIFGGTAGWTRALARAGIAVDLPVELYGDPRGQTDIRPEYDVKDPAVRDRLLQDAAELPGPNVANIWQRGTPCVSFCA